MKKNGLFALKHSEAGREEQNALLRIGMFSESFDPVRNGVTTSLLTLTAQFREMGHNVRIFAPAHSQSPEDETNVTRFPSFISAFNKEYPLAYPFWPRIALEVQFEKLKLDIVHTHTPFVMGLTGANLAHLHRVPLVTTFHTLYWQYSHYMPLLPEGVTNSLLDLYLPWYYNRCAQIICPSQIAADGLTGLGVTRPITIIPTGVPVPDASRVGAEAKRTARAHIGAPQSGPLLLYAGRLAPEKNLIWMLEALAPLLACRPEARLALIGEGVQRQELETCAEALGIAGQTLFPGSQPRERMDALYAAAEVFCFPSVSETQGLVVAEARAAGAPCVVVDAGGAPEMVKEGQDGFRVPEGENSLFADRIELLLKNPALARQMRRNARSNARANTPAAMAARVLEVYAQARKLPFLQIPQETPPIDEAAAWREEALTTDDPTLPEDIG